MLFHSGGVPFWQRRNQRVETLYGEMDHFLVHEFAERKHLLFYARWTPEKGIDRDSLGNTHFKHFGVWQYADASCVLGVVGFFKVVGG